MPSVHRTQRSPYWYCAYYKPDGTRAFRSTRCTDKRKALAVCMKLDEAARKGRQGRLAEAAARDAISEIYHIVNEEKLEQENVRDFLKGWLQKKSKEVAESSYSEYSRAVDCFLEHLGRKASKAMDTVSVRDVGKFRESLSARVSGGTVNKHLKILRGAWRQAQKEGLIRDNVFARTDLVKASEAKRRAFTADEIELILKTCNDEWRGIVLIGLYTGQRLNDIVSLTWRQVDLLEKEIHFYVSKTRKHRTIPIAKQLLRYLMSVDPGDDPDGDLFPESVERKGVGKSTLSRQFVEILAEAGLVPKRPHRSEGKGRNTKRDIAGLSFHCLRHTATSMLKNAGVSDVVAREIIGHDSEVVSRIYTHLDKSTLRNAIASLPTLEIPNAKEEPE